MNVTTADGAGGGPSRAELMLRAAALIYGLATLAVLLWASIPAHQRRLWAMTAADRTSRALDRAACRSGRAALHREAASGVADYTVPYLLSRGRDRAAEVRDRLGCAS